MTYKLVDNVLSIQYEASTDADTVLNLTNHAYFNLDGHKNWGTLDNHVATVMAPEYVPVDELSIPTGGTKKVDGTAMDCRSGRKFLRVLWLNFYP